MRRISRRPLASCAYAPSRVGICLLLLAGALAACAGADDPADASVSSSPDTGSATRDAAEDLPCGDPGACTDAPSLVLAQKDSGAGAADEGATGFPDAAAADPGAPKPQDDGARDSGPADAGASDTTADTTAAEDANAAIDPCIETPDSCECLPCLDRRPVVMVHGVNGSSDDFAAMASRLVADGWPEDWIFRFDARDPSWGCNVDNAADIAALAEQAMASTCTSRVDLVAHSMGTLSSRYFVKNLGGTEVVNTYVTLGGMHHGLSSSCWAPDFLGVCVWQEICQSGDYVKQLNAPPATPGEVHWVSIYGTADESIPNDSSHLDGAENIVMEGVDHVGLLKDEATYEEVKRVLGYSCW
jgi:triacylglycerol lipase